MNFIHTPKGELDESGICVLWRRRQPGMERYPAADERSTETGLSLSLVVNEPHSQRRDEQMLTRLGSIIYRARWAVLLGGMALVVAAAIFGTSVFGLLSAGGFQDPNSESSQAQALLDQRLGGATTDIVIVIQSDTLLATDPAFASAATQMLNNLQARPEVASVLSYYSTHSASFLSRDGHETFAAVQLTPKDITTKQKDFQT